MAVQSLYHADNPVYASFCFYSALVSLKMLLMALLTARQRIAKKVWTYHSQINQHLPAIFTFHRHLPIQKMLSH